MHRRSPWRGAGRTRACVLGFHAGLVVALALSLAAPATAAAQQPVGGASAPPTQAAPPSKAAVFADPLGFLLFGPTVGAEVAIGPYSILALGRWLDAGVAARALFEEERDEFAFSYGGGLKGRYYFGPPLLGPHVGVGLEVLKSRVENQADRVATNNVLLVPEVEAGYRLRLGGFFVGVSAGLGYAVQVSKSVENIAGGNQADRFEAKDVSTVYGSASLDVGLLF